IYQVSVIDTAKDEVIRKIPADEVVRFIERIKDMFGAMLDIQA
ncbi:MAG: flagellar protein FlaG, partial [Synergistaceae bacterium]|nr:flagellar protein FlaG [Synergistaceae bacterium]